MKTALIIIALSLIMVGWLMFLHEVARPWRESIERRKRRLRK